jgi:hypothetical protein
VKQKGKKNPPSEVLKIFFLGKRNAKLLGGAKKSEAERFQQEVEKIHRFQLLSMNSPS